jgi:hypothetical protein
MAELLPPLFNANDGAEPGPAWPSEVLPMPADPDHLVTVAPPIAAPPLRLMEKVNVSAVLAVAVHTHTAQFAVVCWNCFSNQVRPVPPVGVWKSSLAEFHSSIDPAATRTSPTAVVTLTVLGHVPVL